MEFMWRQRWWWLLGFVMAGLGVVGGTGSGCVTPTTTGFVDPGPFESLKAAVEVLRDKNGVAHIYGKTRYEVYFAGGYEMARDRLFQMDLLRRRASGRMAEVFGETYKLAHRDSPFNFKQQDILLRSLGLRFWGEKTAEHLKAKDLELYRLLEAFAAGVTAFIRDAKAGTSGLSLPYGFGKDELDYEPEPWTVVDTLAIGKMQTYGLSDSMQFELLFSLAPQFLGKNLKVTDVLRWEPPDKTTILDGWPGTKASGLHVSPSIAKNPAETQGTQGTQGTQVSLGSQGAKKTSEAAASPAGKSLPSQTIRIDQERLKKALEHLQEVFSSMPTRGGSNNWVLHGKNTTTGKPILANDPHLTLTSPAVFYAIHYQSEDGYKAAGFTFPGLPFVLIGFNEKTAWGATTARGDVTDLYADEVTDGKVKRGGQMQAIEVRKEKLRVRESGKPVKDAAEEEIVIESMATGAFLQDIGGIPAATFGANRIRVHWLGMAVSSEIRSFYQFNTSQSLDDFKKAMSLYEVGAQNFVTTTADGDIGYSARALYPLREKLDPANPPWAIMPAEGYGFTGKYVPDSDVPHSFNPESGWIATANNDPVGTTLDNDPLNDKHYLSFVYDSGYRARRLRERLEEHLKSGKKWSPEETEALQMDSTMLFASRILKPLEAAWTLASQAGADPKLAALAKLPKMAEAVEILRKWDHKAAVDSSGAAVFHVWMALLGRLWFRDDLTGLLYDQAVNALPDALVRPLSYFVAGGKTPDGKDFADDSTTKDSVETREEIMLMALRDTIEHLEKSFAGKAFSEVKWGDIHVVEVRNDFGGRLIPPPLGRSGSVGAIDVSHFNLTGSGGKALNATMPCYHAAIIRIVAQHTDKGLSVRYALFGGQSGIPGHPHFNDHTQDWAVGKMRSFPYQRADVEAAQEGKVTHPAGMK